MKKMILYVVIVTMLYAPFTYAFQTTKISFQQACLTCIGV